ncbi:MAG: hypothetical protein AB7P50_15010 [Alphaproteobacteria bacterium]
MPRIPVYESQVSVPQNGAAPSFDADLGLAPARGLGALARGMGDVARVLAEREDRDALFEAARTMAEVKTSWAARIAEKQQAMPDGAKDFTPGVLKEYDDEVGALVRNTRNAKAQAYLDRQLLGHRNELANAALGLELRARQNYQARLYGDTLAQAKAGVLADPNAHAGWQSMLHAMIDNLDHPPATRAAQKNQADRELGASLAERMLTDDPAALEAALESSDHPIFGALPEAEKPRWLAAGAQARQTSRNADARKKLLQSHNATRDAIQIAADTGLVPPDVTEAMFVSIYGAEEGPQEYRKLRQLADDTSASYRAAGRDAGQNAEILEQRRRAHGNDTQAYQDDPDVRAIEAQRQALSTDPVAYTLKYDPELKRQYAEAAKDPSRWREAIANQRAEQTRLGIPYARQRLLSQPIAQSMAANFEGIADPAERAKHLRTLAESVGAQEWAEFSFELRATGRLSDATAALLHAAAPDCAEHALPGIAAAIAALSTSAPAANEADIDPAALESAQAKTRQAILAEADRLGRTELGGSLAQLGARLAALYVRHGDSAETAAARATATFVGSLP